MKITKKVTFIAKKENIEELKNLLQTMIILSKNENGCLLYDIFQSKIDNTKFIVIESWKDKESLKWHKNSKHYKNYKSKFERFTNKKYSEELDML